VRLANPNVRREAITSRPLLMSSVGRRTEHAGQTTITLTSTHSHFKKARAALMRASALLQGWFAQAAEQFKNQTVWQSVCDHIKLSFSNCAPTPTRHFTKYYATAVG
jgi:Tfp pilus assembly protein PilE